MNTTYIIECEKLTARLTRYLKVQELYILKVWQDIWQIDDGFL